LIVDWPDHYFRLGYTTYVGNRHRGGAAPVLGGLLAAGFGLTHLILVPAHLNASYLGILFIAAGAASVAVAIGLFWAPKRRAVWASGAILAGAIALALICSRTVGLPGVLGFVSVRDSGWGPLENLSLVLELAFVALAWWHAPALRRAPRADGDAAVSPRVVASVGMPAIPVGRGVSRRGALAAAFPLLAGGAAARLFGGTSLGLAAAPATAARLGDGHPGATGGAVAQPPQGGHRSGGHGGFRGGSVDHRANGFDPAALLRDFDSGKTRRLASGRVLREWEIVAEDKEIEIAPGIRYPAWTYNGRIPGPTLRCREGELLRIKFVNASTHPHTIHFHGIHPASMDGVPGAGDGAIATGHSTVYEFDATPFGLHLYHCHTMPLAIHIAKGLYGAFIVDPKRGRPDADELLMVMNAFDTDFDSTNEVYAVNSIGFAYERAPIKVKRGELVRIYLANLVEYDPINSFHIHGNFFHYYPTGTSLEPVEFTDTIMQAQGQRGILELRFPYAGRFLFHAHKTEFAELGWLGTFEVTD